MTVQTWTDLGSAERINDAISDMEMYTNRALELLEFGATIRVRKTEADDQIYDAQSALIDIISDLRTCAHTAREALTRVPREDATQGERQDWGRSRVEREAGR